MRYLFFGFKVSPRFRRNRREQALGTSSNLQCLMPSKMGSHVRIRLWKIDWKEPSHFSRKLVETSLKIITSTRWFNHPWPFYPRSLGWSPFQPWSEEVTWPSLRFSQKVTFFFAELESLEDDFLKDIEYQDWGFPRSLFVYNFGGPNSPNKRNH